MVAVVRVVVVSVVVVSVVVVSVILVWLILVWLILVWRVVRIVVIVRVSVMVVVPGLVFVEALALGRAHRHPRRPLTVEAVLGPFRRPDAEEAAEPELAASDAAAFGTGAGVGHG
jgi:hypothetical protein